MTGRELHEALLAAGVEMIAGEPFDAQPHAARDSLEQAAAMLTPGKTYPAPVSSPIDPPTISRPEETAATASPSDSL